MRKRETGEKMGRERERDGERNERCGENGYKRGTRWWWMERWN